MSLKLTYEQLGWVVEKTGIESPKEALEYFATLMKQEGIPPRKMPLVVEKLMDRERRKK